MQWFELDAATGDVRGWTRSSKATALPPSPAGVSLVEATDAQIAEYETLHRQVQGERRSVRVQMLGGALSVPVDTRQRARVEADKTTVVGGADIITLTITALKDDGSVRTGLTKQVDFETLGGRIIRLDFVNGVAIKQINMPASGRFRIQSNDVIAVEAEVEITAVE